MRKIISLVSIFLKTKISNGEKDCHSFNGWCVPQSKKLSGQFSKGQESRGGQSH